MLGSGYPGTPLRNMQELLLLLERPPDSVAIHTNDGELRVPEHYGQ